MATRFRQQPRDVDFLVGATATVPENTANRSLASIDSRSIDFVKELDELAERDLAPTVAGSNARDLAFLEPLVQRRLGDTEQPRAICGPDRWADKIFKNASDRGELVSQGDGAVLALHLADGTGIELALVARGRREDVQDRHADALARPIADEAFGRSLLLRDPDGLTL